MSGRPPAKLCLLAIETSSATGTVALAAGGELAERTIATPREQTDQLLGLVEALLSEAGIGLDALDAIAFGRGPGSFTGLRIAAAVAQGLSLASGRPIVGASSLAALALRALDAGEAAAAGGGGAAEGRAAAGVATTAAAAVDRALCVVDARMGEVYSGCYRLVAGLPVAETEERLGAPAAVAAPAAPFIAVGDGLTAHAAALEGVARAAAGREPGLEPRARELVRLAAAEVEAGRFLPLEAALPVYLREAGAWRQY